MRVITKILNIIKPFVCYLSIYIFAFIICSIINLVYILMIGLLHGNLDFNVDIFSDNTEYYILIVRCITIFIYYKWYKKLKKNDYLSYERNLLSPDKIYLTLCGIGTTLVIYGVINLMYNLLVKYYPILRNEYMRMERMNSDMSIVSVINTVVTAPLSEELVFRGVMFIYTFPIGLWYGYITKRYKSIQPVIYLHVLNNAIALIITILTKNEETLINISILLWVLLTIISICFNIIFIYNEERMRR